MRFLKDPRFFNIADAPAGDATDTPPAQNGDPPDTGAGAGEAGAEQKEGGASTSAPAFTDWTADALKPLIPQGFDVADDQAAELLKIVNESKGDPSKIVGGMLGYYAQTSQKVVEELATTYNQTQANWQDEMRKDPVYGGAKFDESLRTAKEVATRLGGPGFLELLSVTGAGNSVHMLRMLNEAAKLLPKEAAPSNGRPSAQPKTLGERLFPGNSQG